MRTTEEEKILARLERIRALAEIHEQESAVTQVSKARQIGQLFAGQSNFDLNNAGYGVIGITSRQELVQRIMKGRNTLTSLELALHEPEVSITGDTAHARVRGSALGSTRGVAGQFLEIHLVDVELEKQEDDWVVTGARHIRDERQPESEQAAKWSASRQ